MPRIRTVKLELWTHEDLSALPVETHVLAASLLNYADDCGYFNANPKLIQATLFPLRELSSTVPVMLRELSSIGYLRLFKGTDGKQYGQICKFTEHQVVSHPKPSKIQPLEPSSNCPVKLHEQNGLKGKEGNGKEGKGSDTPDSLMQLVGTELKLSDRWVKVSCSEQIRFAMQTGEDGQAIVTRMIESGNKYRAGPDFKYGGWKKFFDDGIWNRNGDSNDNRIAEAIKLADSED